MITVTDVIRAVSGVCEDVFGAPPVSKDIREGFDRPCCYVTPVDVRRSRVGKLRQETVELEIVYLAPRTSRGWSGLLRAQADLGAALELPVEVAEDFHILAEDPDFDPVREDMALYCTFSVTYFQERSADPDGGSGETMEQLSMTVEGAAAPADDGGAVLLDEAGQVLTDEGGLTLTDEGAPSEAAPINLVELEGFYGTS